MNDRSTPVDAPADLRMGLQLIRASTLASTRVQLALARSDRSQAMAALDGLIDIDAEIERFVEKLPAPSAANPDMAAITEWLAEQKRAVASEKFSLACEAAGPRIATLRNQMSVPVEKVEKPEPAISIPPWEVDEGETSSRGRLWLLAVILLPILALIAGATLTFPAETQDILHRLPTWAEIEASIRTGFG